MLICVKCGYNLDYLDKDTLECPMCGRLYDSCGDLKDNKEEK